MMKNLKSYAHTLPIMETRYCSNDDFNYIVDKLKYLHVKKGHYIVR